MLIRGDRLTDRQRAEVLRVFVHRWTVENTRQTYGGKCPACVQNRRIVERDQALGVSWHARHAPLTTDQEWLAAHAFHFLKDGSRLSGRTRYAVPAFLVDDGCITEGRAPTLAE